MEKVAAEAEDIPKAIIRRIVKNNVSSSDINLHKDALHAFSETARIFIHYLAATANDICKESKRQTINAEDVFKAIEEIEFLDFIEPLRASLDEFKQKNAGKRSAALKEQDMKKKQKVEESSQIVGEDKTNEDDQNERDENKDNEDEEDSKDDDDDNALDDKNEDDENELDNENEDDKNELDNKDDYNENMLDNKDDYNENMLDSGNEDDRNELDNRNEDDKNKLDKDDEKELNSKNEDEDELTKNEDGANGTH